MKPQFFSGLPRNQPAAGTYTVIIEFRGTPERVEAFIARLPAEGIAGLTRAPSPSPSRTGTSAACETSFRAQADGATGDETP